MLLKNLVKPKYGLQLNMHFAFENMLSQKVIDIRRCNSYRFYETQCYYYYFMIICTFFSAEGM